MIQTLFLTPSSFKWTEQGRGFRNDYCRIKMQNQWLAPQHCWPWGKGQLIVEFPKKIHFWEKTGDCRWWSAYNIFIFMRNAVDRKSLPPSPGMLSLCGLLLIVWKFSFLSVQKPSNFFLHDQVSQLLLVCVTSSIRLFRHFGHLNSLFVYMFKIKGKCHGRLLNPCNLPKKWVYWVNTYWVIFFKFIFIYSTHLTLWNK